MNRRMFLGIPVAAQVAAAPRPRVTNTDWMTVNQVADWSATTAEMGAKIKFQVGQVISIEETPNPNVVIVSLTNRSLFLFAADASKLGEMLGV